MCGEIRYVVDPLAVYEQVDVGVATEGGEKMVVALPVAVGDAGGFELGQHAGANVMAGASVVRVSGLTSGLTSSAPPPAGQLAMSWTGGGRSARDVRPGERRGARAGRGAARHRGRRRPQG